MEPTTQQSDLPNITSGPREKVHFSLIGGFRFLAARHCPIPLVTSAYVNKVVLTLEKLHMLTKEYALFPEDS